MINFDPEYNIVALELTFRIYGKFVFFSFRWNQMQNKSMTK